MKPVRWLLFLYLSCFCGVLTPALSQPAPRRVQIAPQTGPLAGQTVYTNSYALLVGINRYQNLPEKNWLDFARVDVLAFRETLVRSYGFPSENIITLLDEQATRDNIQTALTYLADKKRVQPTDRLLIYFSCHGQAIETPSGGKEGFLIPYDARIDLKDPSNRIAYYRYALPMRDLWAYVESGAARHCTVIADACFGGLLARPRGAPLGDVTLKTLLSKPAYQVFSAGGQNESAWEDPALGHSVLMHSLLKELQRRSEAKDTTFTLTDLFGSVRDVVIEKSEGKQKPLLQSYGGTEGDMVFVTTSRQTVPALVSGLPPSENQPERAVKAPRVRAAELVTSGNEKYEQKAYGEAEAFYRQAMVIDPTYAQGHFRLGRLLHIVTKDYTEAERLYKKAIELDPHFAFAYNNLGVLFDNKKDYPEAERLYKKAIEVDPHFAFAYNNLGVLFENKKDYPEAERFYKKAIEVDPKYAFAYFNLGSLYKDIKKDYKEAERLYKKAIEVDPHFAFAYNNLGVLFENKKDYPEAERFYKKAIEVDPKFAGAYSNLGILCYKIKKDYGEAERLYKKAIEVDPKFAGAYFNLGNLYYKKADYTEAERFYRKAIEVDSKDAIAHANLALCLFQQKRKDEARKEAQVAKDLGLTEHSVYKLLDP